MIRSREGCSNLLAVTEGRTEIDEDQGETLRLVCFRVRDQELALPIEDVRETIRVRPVTRVFLTPSWMAGIFSLRGEIVPAIDVAPWLGMPPTLVREDTRLVVVRHPTKTLALLADDLSELRTLHASEVTAPPPTLELEQAALLSGVAATATGIVRILSTQAIFSSERLRAISAPAS